jgi:hypothetical protein
VRVEWIGFWANLVDNSLGITTKRANWLVGWMRAQVEAGTSDMRDFVAVLGRLCFAMGPLEFLRPFVAPLFSWAAAVGNRGNVQLPWSVTFLLEFLATELQGGGRVEVVRPTSADLGLAFRADAKAEGQSVCVGGWECLGNARPAEARWFSVDLTKANAPWAFSRGEPFRTIASLELYATLLCIVLFGDSWPCGARGAVRLQGVTDNLGNTFVLTKLMSSKFPLVVVLAELSAQLRSRGMSLDLEWAPRDQNEEADALTNKDFAAFDPALRVEVDVSSIGWLILPKMLEVASNIYKRVQDSKAGKAKDVLSAAASTYKGKPLRQRDPW